MATQYQNQSVAYSDLAGNTAELIPGTGLVITTPTQTLTTNVTGFSNGTQSLLFTDLYATVEKTKAVKFATSTTTKLSVEDSIELVDNATLPTKKNTITPTSILIDDLVGNTSQLTNTALTITSGVTSNTLDASNWSGNIQTVNTTSALTHYLNFSDASTTGYGRPQKTAGISCTPSTATITATNFNGLASTATTAVGINLTSDNTAGTYFIPFSKTITATGNTMFIDNVTGPLTYNPSTSVLTCTSFAGSCTTVDLTSDNTSGTYYIPFSKTVTATGNALFIDNTTTPLSYNPSTSTLTCTNFSGALTGNATTCTNATNCALATTFTLATFATNTLTIVGSSTSSFLSYNINITGTTNTLSSITYTTPRLNGWYRVGIYNAGTGDLTINSTIGGTATTRTNLSANLIVPTLRYAYMEIHSFTINALQQYIANIYLLTP